MLLIFTMVDIRLLWRKQKLNHFLRNLYEKVQEGKVSRQGEDSSRDLEVKLDKIQEGADLKVEIDRPLFQEKNLKLSLLKLKQEKEQIDSQVQTNKQIFSLQMTHIMIMKIENTFMMKNMMTTTLLKVDTIFMIESLDIVMIRTTRDTR